MDQPKKLYVKKKLHVLPRDVKVFTFIETYIKQHGFSPLLDEIGAHFGCRRQSIMHTLRRLEEMGAIHRERNATRGITPLQNPTLFNSSQT